MLSGFVMKIYSDVYARLISAFPVVPPETGAILGTRDGVIVSDFWPDKNATNMNCAIYVPNVDYLNHIIERWAEEGIAFCGLLHTHPNSCEMLSSEDEQYIESVMSKFDEGQICFFPVLIPYTKMIAYTAVKGVGGSCDH